MGECFSFLHKVLIWQMPGSNRRCKKYGTNLQLCKAALQLLGLNALLVCLLQPVHQLSIAALLMRDCSHSLAGSRHNFLPWEPLPAFHRQCSLQPDDPTVERKGKERKGKERKGKERKGKERKGKEGKGKERLSLLAPT